MRDILIKTTTTKKYLEQLENFACTVKGEREGEKKRK